MSLSKQVYIGAYLKAPPAVEYSSEMQCCLDPTCRKFKQASTSKFCNACGSKIGTYHEVHKSARFHHFIDKVAREDLEDLFSSVSRDGSIWIPNKPSFTKQCEMASIWVNDIDEFELRMPSDIYVKQLIGDFIAIPVVREVLNLFETTFKDKLEPRFGLVLITI